MGIAGHCSNSTGQPEATMERTQWLNVIFSQVAKKGQMSVMAVVVAVVWEKGSQRLCLDPRGSWTEVSGQQEAWILLHNMIWIKVDVGDLSRFVLWEFQSRTCRTNNKTLIQLSKTNRIFAPTLSGHMQLRVHANTQGKGHKNPSQLRFQILIEHA